MHEKKYLSKNFERKKNLNKLKEIHLWLDLDGIYEMVQNNKDFYIAETVANTELSMESTLTGIIHTTIPYFLSFSYADKLFVHRRNKIYELTIDDIRCDYPVDPEKINVLEALIINGHFDFHEPLHCDLIGFHIDNKS